MADLRSVTASAKALGMSRQRLNILLDEAKVDRVKQGREALVSFPNAQAAVQAAASAGRVRTPKKHPISDTQETTGKLWEQLAAKEAEIKRLSGELQGYEALKAEMKFIKGEIERKGAETQPKQGILSRLDKAIQTFRGENL
jgi:hypothetical protein